MKKEKKLILEGRDLLKRDWDSVDFDNTDQALKLPMPNKKKDYDTNCKIIDLLPQEKWNIKNVSLLDAIINRKSNRKYNEDCLSLGELSFLLYATQGVKKETERASFRTVPSGGARHSFETYLYIDRVEGIDKGLYRYLPFEHKLILEKEHYDGMQKELEDSLLEQGWNAAVTFIWTTIPYRDEWRYSAHSAKLIALDAGHVCQNLYLACEDIGAGTCAIGAYKQELVDRFLGVDGEEEFTVYISPVGKI